MKRIDSSFHAAAMQLHPQTLSTNSPRPGAVMIPLRKIRNTGGFIEPTPVTVGVPCPQGGARGELMATLRARDIGTLLVQVKPLVHWPDGSVKWLLCDFIAPPEFVDGNLLLEIIPSNGTHSNRSTLRIANESEGKRVSTGTHQFNIPGTQLQPFLAVNLLDDLDAGYCGAGELVIVDRHGRSQYPQLDGWHIESRGPVRLTIVGEGHFPAIHGLQLRLRESFFADSGLVRIDITLHNPRRARHRGGLWDLGDPGSTLFQDLSLNVDLPPLERRSVSWSLSPDGPSEWRNIAELALYQDSSGGVNWDSANHVNREGRVPCKFRGYRLTVDDCQTAGLRATPTLQIDAGRAHISAAFPDFWQQFPKAITLDHHCLRFGFFPQEYDDLFELQGGESKTHTIWLRFADASSKDRGGQSLAWVHRPIQVLPTIDWCETTTVLRSTMGSNGDSEKSLETILKEATHGERSIPVQREKVDEYGWRNYGDVFADHEQLHYHGAKPLVSHFNNQFDMLYGFLVHTLRTAEPHWWEWANALARHVVDIDIYRTKEDKAAYNGGLFWFTDHYLHAHKSTHRTFSICNRGAGSQAYGGGPSAEHNFTSGLLLHYCLTGNPSSRETVVMSADWVIAMDDGRRNFFGILDEGSTGFATGTSVDHRVLGRGGGNSINALLDAWVLTGDTKYLAFAETLIRRSVHPKDNIEERGLLDIERSWSYTVFLKSLSRYLDLKIEAKQLDERYGYAQACLVHYAQWMLVHERPYFEQVEKMEFPTEAWAAQELRKANVFRLAAPHADEPVQLQLHSRGDELSDRAWKDLMQFETRASARSLAIVMTEGLLDCALRSRDHRPLPKKEIRDVGEPAIFVSQRQRLKSAALRPAGIISIIARLINPFHWAQLHGNGDALSAENRSKPREG